MALTLNGSTNTIGGLAVGGLPDGTVDSDTLAAGVGGKFASYAIIADRKTQNTNGGTITAGAWRTRDLNTEIADADGIVSISSNQFTLQAGTYDLIAHFQILKPGDRGGSRLYNITDSSVVETGESIFGNTNATFVFNLYSRFTISAAKVFEIQNRVNTTYTTYGAGVAGNHTAELYTYVEIFKEVS